MVKKSSFSKNDLQELQKNLSNIQNRVAELTNLYEQLAQLEAVQLVRWVELFEELNSEISVAKIVLANSKTAFAKVCQLPGSKNNPQVWEMITDYLMNASQLLKCAETLHELALKKFAGEKQLGSRFIKEIDQQCEGLKQVIKDLNQQVIVYNTFDLQTLFTTAKTIRLANPEKTNPRSRGGNPIYALTAKLITSQINALAVPKDAIVKQVIEQQLDDTARVFRLNLNKGELSVPAIFREAVEPSDECCMFISGAGDHPFNNLQLIADIAAKLKVNYLTVDHVSQYATHFIKPVAKIIAGLDYLIAVKGMKITDITLIGHSNGGRLALEAADYCKRVYGEAPKVVLNNSYNTLEDASINLVKKVLAKKPSHKPMLSMEASPVEQAFSDLATRELKKAFEQNDETYNAEEFIQRVGPARVASIYTGVKTQRNEFEQKWTKPRDQVLSKAQQGRMRNKKVKQNYAEYHKAIGKMDFTLPSGDIYRYKDMPQQDHSGYLVIKRYMPTDAKDIHNEVDIDCIVHAVRRLTEQQAILAKHQTLADDLRQRFNELLKNQEIGSRTRSFLVGLTLSSEELLLLKEVFAQLTIKPELNWPTQKQLMALFQADGYIAELITGNPATMNRMLQGDGHTEQLHTGLSFLEQKLSLVNLQQRLSHPDGRVDGIGSFLESEQVERIQQQIVKHQHNFKRSPMRASMGFFDAEHSEEPPVPAAPAKKSPHIRRPAIDLDEDTELAQAVSAGAA